MLKPGLYEQIIKNVVANAPDTYNIPVIQLERKISEINDDIAFSVKVKLQNDFGVVVTGFDIGEIEIDKSISNLLAAVEKGLFSNATNLRLKQLEEQQAIINEQLILEKSKNKSALTKEDILGYIRLALKKEARKMINLLVDKVVLYDKKIEIYYKYQKTKSPDDKSQGFIFYQNIAFYQKTRVVKNDFIKKTNLEDKEIEVFHQF